MGSSPGLDVGETVEIHPIGLGTTQAWQMSALSSRFRPSAAGAIVLAVGAGHLFTSQQPVDIGLQLL